jgi:hypothetical protein
VIILGIPNRERLFVISNSLLEYKPLMLKTE